MFSLDQFWVIAIDAAPTLLALLFAGFLCLTKGRRNPRGAVLLGGAILVTIVQWGASYGFIFVSTWATDLFPNNPEYLIYGIQFMTSCLGGLAWVLIALAVFARTPDDEPFLFEYQDERPSDPMV